jgi:Family of unknown function (DUF6152)
MQLWIRTLVAALLLSSNPVAAHHSIAAIYDSSRPRTLDGVVTGFAFIHPHPFITLEIRDGKSAPQSWRLEMDNRFELEGIGVTESTFKPGDRLVVTGSAGRNQALALYIRRLDRPVDGFFYEQVGPSPRIGTPR